MWTHVPLCLGLVTVFEWAVCVWLLAVGACVGSFLNVVIYRLPRGEPLTYPPSRCPRCGRRIALRDNIPVLSWLALRGRCRWCGGAISPRYPLVEGMTGVAFLALGVAVYVGGAAHLPAPAVTSAGGGARLAPGAMAPPAALVGYHATLLAYLIAAAGIGYDGQRLPARLTMVALLVGAGAALAWPELRPLAAVPQAPRGAWGAVVDTAAGLIVGGLLGLVIAAAVRPASGSPSAGGDAVCLSATVGAYLGWQTAIALVTLAAVAHVPLAWMRAARRGLGRWEWSGVLCGTTMIGVLAWRPLLGQWWLQSPARTLAATAGALAITASAAALARCTAGGGEPSRA